MAASGLGDGNNVTNSIYAQDVQQAPLYFPLAGSYYYTQPRAQGLYAYYWTRMAHNTYTSGAIRLRISADLGEVLPNDNIYKELGMSVRCVFGS